MTHEVNITRMDAFTYRDLISSGDAVVLIPVGSVEQHGAHMPLGTDMMLSTKMSELTAQQIGAIVGPTISFGYKSQQRSGGGNHIVGTFGFDADTVIGICRTLVREFSRHGVNKIVFVNGHYENYQFVYEGVDLAMRDLAGLGEGPRVMPVVLLGLRDAAGDRAALPRGLSGLGCRTWWSDGDLPHARVLPRTRADGPAHRPPSR